MCSATYFARLRATGITAYLVNNVLGYCRKAWSQHVHLRMKLNPGKLGDGPTWSDNMMPNNILNGSSCVFG